MKRSPRMLTARRSEEKKKMKINPPSICPHCKTWCPEGWHIDHQTEKVVCYTLKGHRCPEQRPYRLLRKTNGE